MIKRRSVFCCHLINREYCLVSTKFYKCTLVFIVIQTFVNKDSQFTYAKTNGSESMFFWLYSSNVSIFRQHKLPNSL